ncbi:universal stress protein [Mycobacterium antarcticum]|uniref:universal stress protein n=1 Tax=unclassified Mycolicibacterium TaxID=2636767 RepID=UPI00238B5CC7|nr:MULTISPECIES: universal stress protein [unclassified Mycolicibacterium]BDX35180.1 universal stress protein [Mycolicibacterium sp. TUM20985]GLP78389.1 universal stress protein [Mycolicibacterium sp. TUM20983]GLP81442.1 universal stress protein [Mycolicibacterium sp. TUM20984]
MNTFVDNGQPVVVGVDGSDSALAAALWAAEFVAKSSSPLVLLHAVARLDWHFLGEAQAPAIDGNDTADSVLGAAKAAVLKAHPDLDVRCETIKESVASALQDASEGARLLVVGTGADGGALGSHVVRITHRALCPVLVWRTPVAHRTGKPLPIVVGIDESEDSLRALTVAFDTAHVLHAPLTVVHMWEIGAAVGLGYSQGLMDWKLLDLLQTQQRQRMDELVAPLAKKHPNTHVGKIFRDIGPAKGLTELSGDAQLVVVGSHGRGRIAAATLGSVSQNVIHHAQCPVLVVR